MFAVLKNLLSSLFQSSPVIEPVEFRDGLLAFRCERRLPFEALTVASRTPAGAVRTEIMVCSYEPGQRLYRALLPDSAQNLARMQVTSRGTRRLAQAVRVSSRQIATYFALTEDISTTGLRLVTPDLLAIGSTLEMRLDLDDPNVPTVTVNGEVCWSAMKADGSHHSGVRFVGLNNTTHRILERYIDSRLATQRTVHGEG